MYMPSSILYIFFFILSEPPARLASEAEIFQNSCSGIYACITPSTFIHLLNTMHSFDFEKTRCDNTIFRVSANTLFTFHSSFFILYFFMKLTDSRSLQRSPFAYPTLFQFFIFPMHKRGGVAVNGTENRFNIIIIIRSSLQAHIWHKRI